MKQQLNEIKRMQQLAGIINESWNNADYNFDSPTLLRNLSYLRTYAPAIRKDRGLGTDEASQVSAPYTVAKIVQAIKPLVAREDVYDNPEVINDLLQEFSGWLQGNIGKYESMFIDNPKLTARELYEQVWLDFIIEINELDLDDNTWTDPAGGTHYGNEDDPAAMYK